MTLDEMHHNGHAAFSYARVRAAGSMRPAHNEHMAVHTRDSRFERPTTSSHIRRYNALAHLFQVGLLALARSLRARAVLLHSLDHLFFHWPVLVRCLGLNKGRTALFASVLQH
jgi:hypothetical protein